MSWSRGIVLKNDVNRRAGTVHEEGYVLDEYRVHCKVCKKVIQDDETIYYAFKNRGGDSHASCYFHLACEPENAVTPFTDRRTSCCFCGVSEDLDRAVPTSHGGNVVYHAECLEPKVGDERISVEVMKRLLSQRNKGRLSRGTIRYGVQIRPYSGFKLEYGKGSKWSTEDEYAFVGLRTLDGKLREVRYGYNIVLFESGSFMSPENIQAQISGVLKETRVWHGTKSLTEEDAEAILQLYDDLKEHYNGKGKPKGDRVDVDYRMRFLLTTGNSIEGFVNAKRDEYEAAEED